MVGEKACESRSEIVSQDEDRPKGLAEGREWFRTRWVDGRCVRS